MYQIFMIYKCFFVIDNKKLFIIYILLIFAYIISRSGCFKNKLLNNLFQIVSLKEIVYGCILLS